MPGVGVIDHAADLSSKMVARESRGPGDTENAMRRLEAKYGLPFSALWSLRYRKPKDMLASVYVQLCAAYEHECNRQQKLLDHERAIARAKSGLGETLIRAADALARATGDAQKG